jgi:hypothetical protein
MHTRLVRRFLHPFVLVVSAILLAGYAYIAARLTSTAPARVALAAPFVMVWILPVVYWFGDRDRRGRGHEWVQALSFLCMGWLSFLLVLTVARDLLLLATVVLPPLAAVRTLLDEAGAWWVPVAALAAVGVGALPALRGPYVRRVDIPVEGLAPDLDGLRIVQISDLHIAPTTRLAYVQRVVAMTEELAPDLIALTGDIVDGSVPRLGPLVAPLEALTSGDRAFFVLGNHDYYSGAAPWTAHFEAMGFRVLRNAHVTIARGAARLLIGGIIDFAARMYDSRRAATSGPRDRRRRAAGLPSAPGAQSEDRAAGPAGRLRPATVGTHARRPVLPVDVRDSPGPRAARGRALAPRPHVGLRQRRHGDVGSARAPRHEAGAHPPATRGREWSAALVNEREESPLSGIPFSECCPRSSKARVRSDDDVLHRAGHQDVTRAGESLDARRDVHRHPRQRAPLQLAFASVDTGPDVDTEALHGLSRRPGTFERARRGFEADKESVPSGVDLDAFAPRDLGTHCQVMLREHGAPAGIAQPAGMLGGADDVGEEQRGEECASPRSPSVSDASMSR